MDMYETLEELKVIIIKIEKWVKTNKNYHIMFIKESVGPLRH